MTDGPMPDAARQPPRQPRPTPRIALLTCRHHDHIDHASEGKLMQELVRQGAIVTLAAWDDVLTPVKDEDGPFAGEMVSADVYVLRTTWDYWDSLDRFREFLNVFATDERDGGGLQNTPTTALANLNKIYLQELQLGGVPIVPTLFVKRGGEPDAIAQARSNGWGAIVTKPAVGAAASGLEKFDRPDGDALAALAALTRGNRLALLQPYLPRITTEGETSLVYFNNALSHAVTKVPAQGDFRSQVDFCGAYTLVEPTEQQQDVAERALAAWEDRFGDKPLYARVDLVPDHDGQPLLGELELIEPELFLDMADGAAETFASAILARVEERQYTPEPWWHGRLMGIGCFLVAATILVGFATGAGVIIAWIIDMLSGGP
ncbi:MAG: RimK family alpha-L-glutamate ligase [Phycisphaerales bacterium JB060]